MDFRLNKQQAKMVEENMNLVPFVLRRMKIPLDYYDDAISEGNLALMQAVYYFNKHLGFRFSTFAYKVIRNHLNNYFFPTIFPDNKVVFSLSTSSYKEEDKINIEDFLVDETSNFEKAVEYRNFFQTLINNGINCLSGRTKATFLYKLAGCTDLVIAKHLQRSTSRIVDFRQMAAKKLKETNQDNKEVFHMEIQEKTYKLTFATKDIAKFNQIFAKFLYDISNEEKINHLPSFRLNCTKEQVLLTLPAEPSSFVLIGLLMEQIETFSMQHVAGFKPSFPEKILENSSNILPIVNTESSPTAQRLPSVISIPERKRKLNEIRKYMQSQNSFSIKDLVKQFPDVPYHSISDLLGREKKKKNIYAIEKGVYSKNSSYKPHNDQVNNIENNLQDTLKENSTSKKQKIREYILTLQEFSSSDIQKHFSDIHYQSIILVIRQMKNENLIKSTSYGNYIVIAS